jgi:class 3 adenylate cyclase
LRIAQHPTDAEDRIARRLAAPHQRSFSPIDFGIGCIVKTTGDGILLEFPSIVAAVEFAIAVQKLMARRNADVPTGAPSDSKRAPASF